MGAGSWGWWVRAGTWQRRSTTLVFADRNRTSLVRRRLPRTKNADRCPGNTGVSPPGRRAAVRATPLRPGSRGPPRSDGTRPRPRALGSAGTALTGRTCPSIPLPCGGTCGLAEQDALHPVLGLAAIVFQVLPDPNEVP